MLSSALQDTMLLLFLLEERSKEAPQDALTSQTERERVSLFTVHFFNMCDQLVAGVHAFEN